MSPKTRNIIGWILTSLIAIVFLMSAFMKLTGSEAAIKGAAALGLTADTLRIVGIIEVLSILLFIIPRTGMLGTLLVAAYLGGAIATHLEHHESVMAPVIIQCVVWITATIRFPELSRRLMGKSLNV